LKARITTIIIIGLLLCVALAAAIFTAEGTVRAVQGFQKQGSLVRASDVRTIRPWMTIPYIAHTYHVPESYLYTTLRIANSPASRHTPLYTLAKQKSVTTVVTDVQRAILTYRKQHPYRHPPKPKGHQTTHFNTVVAGGLCL